MDVCMVNLVSMMELNGMKPVASCCGHGKYKPSIVIQDRIGGYHLELISGIVIPRKKRFYKKDKDGYFFIPECVI